MTTADDAERHLAAVQTRAETQALKVALAQANARRKLLEKLKAEFEPEVGGGKRKPGRPVAEKPWEAEGISRIAWYRRGGRIKK